MSNIYQAYKKQGVDYPDIAERLQRAGSLQLFPQPHQSQQEEFSRLSLRLLKMKEEERGLVIAMASSATGEGASFVSYNLATFLALVYDQKVAWIDSNTLNPQEELKHHEGASLAELLKEPERARELPSNSAQITLVPAGRDLRSKRALFADKNYPALLKILGERFDFVVLDLPPVLESQDASLIAQKTDGMLLVVAHRRLKRETINSGVKSLQAVGVEILGAVLNRREFDLPNFLHKWI